MEDFVIIGFVTIIAFASGTVIGNAISYVVCPPERHLCEVAGNIHDNEGLLNV